jgi:hypothetical protein
MKYEELKIGDSIFYLEVTPELAKKIPDGNVKMQETIVLSIRRDGENYFIDTDKLGEFELTPKEFFENESDTAYSETDAIVIATTQQGFIKELEKLLFEE